MIYVLLPGRESKDAHFYVGQRVWRNYPPYSYLDLGIVCRVGYGGEDALLEILFRNEDTLAVCYRSQIQPHLEQFKIGDIVTCIQRSSSLFGATGTLVLIHNSQPRQYPVAFINFGPGDRRFLMDLRDLSLALEYRHE